MSTPQLCQRLLVLFTYHFYSEAKYREIEYPNAGQRKDDPGTGDAVLGASNLAGMHRDTPLPPPPSTAILPGRKISVTFSKISSDPRYLIYFKCYFPKEAKNLYLYCKNQ